MKSTRCGYRRMMAPVIACAILAGVAATADADPAPLSKDEQTRIDQAIDRAVAFLSDAQTEKGYWKWKMYRDGRFEAAQAALPAYALLESGVPPGDPVIQKAADYVRRKVRDSDFTYEIALTLLFLDRLGDPGDKKLISTLALRLIAGQHHTGGWSYRCPLPSAEAERDLLFALERLAKAMTNNGLTREAALRGLVIPQTVQPLPPFRPSAELIWREPPQTSETIAASAARFSPVGRTDNSNTQFALLGLWAAQRHSVPVKPSFALLVERFERTHAYPAGTWGYSPDEEDGSRSMICVGLMGLAIGRGLQLPTAGAPADKKDVHVLKGLAALSRRIGRPAGRMDKPVSFHDLYFLWSIERVAMLYDLSAIGDRDWYRWGAESLVTNQAKGGFWTGASPNPEWAGKKNYDYRATLTTAFALLFLKRSHPMKDLTPRLPMTGKDLNDSLARLRPDEKFPLRPLATSSPSRKSEP